MDDAKVLIVIIGSYKRDFEDFSYSVETLYVFNLIGASASLRSQAYPYRVDSAALSQK